MKNRTSFYFCSKQKWTREHKNQHWKWYLYIWLELMIYVRVKNRSVVKGFSQNHTIILKLVLDRNSLRQHISYKLILISNPWCIWERQKLQRLVKKYYLLAKVQMYKSKKRFSEFISRYSFDSTRFCSWWTMSPAVWPQGPEIALKQLSRWALLVLEYYVSISVTVRLWKTETPKTVFLWVTHLFLAYK